MQPRPRVKSAIHINTKKRLSGDENEEKEISPRRLNELIESIKKEG